MGKKKQDPAFNVAPKPEPLVESLTAVAAPEPTEVKGVEDLMALTARDIAEEIADDELQSYYVGMRGDSPIDNVTLFGVTLARRQGEYSTEAGGWMFEKGAYVSISERLEKCIRARAAEIFVLCEIRKDKDGQEYAAKVKKKLDLRSKPQAVKNRKIRSIERQRTTINKTTGIKQTWFPLSRFIVLERAKRQALTSYDAHNMERKAFAAEAKELREKIDALQSELDQRDRS